MIPRITHRELPDRYHVVDVDAVTGAPEAWVTPHRNGCRLPDVGTETITAAEWRRNNAEDTA